MIEIIILFLAIAFTSTFLMVFVKYRSDRLFRSMTNFESYAAVLEYHMNKAFDMIYKDKLMIYSIEGMKVSDKDFGYVSKDFANLVLKLIGSTLKEEFIFLYGSEDTLFFNMVEFFNTKYEMDEIQKSASNSIVNNDDTGYDKIFGA